MSETPPPSADKLPPAEFSPPPNWDHVPFDVGCARCGHDLRGRTESSCPACNLTFDWAVAVPIEQLTCVHCDYHLYGLEDTRCPECGSEFTWSEVLGEYHRRHQPYFEFRWRDRPIRSLIRTWRATFRPKRFWHSIDIQSPPRVVPLLAQTLITLGISVLEAPVGIGLIGWFFNVFLDSWGLGLAACVASVSKLPRHVLDALAIPEAFTLPLAFLSPWIGASLLALLVFQQSMRRAKVRFPQILRVWANSIQTAALLVIPTGLIVIFYVDIVTPWRGRFSYIPVVLLLIPPIHAVWSLRQGYRYYLRMPHALAVALCSQLIALLAAVTTVAVVQLVRLAR